MQDGTHVIYVLQCRRIAESPWLKPNEPLVELDERDWHFASKDGFGYETYRGVRFATDWDGWFELDDARKELSRIRERDEKGDYDDDDCYGKKHRSVRHQFRLVKLKLSQETSLV